MAAATICRRSSAPEKRTKEARRTDYDWWTVRHSAANRRSDRTSAGTSYGIAVSAKPLSDGGIAATEGGSRPTSSVVSTFIGQWQRDDCFRFFGSGPAR